MSESKQVAQMFFLLLTSLVAIQQVHSSGIFELNLSALTDVYGRDLRQLDCCAWQNASQENNKQQQVLNSVNSATTPVSSRFGSVQTQQAGASESCDPTKCQLIIRICVKNYQTQIDPSQCTFGELTAQVMRPDERHYHHHHSSGHHHSQQQQQQHAANHMSSLARLQQQQQLASYQRLKLSTSNGNGILNGQPVANIHHQRMLMQQLQQAPYLSMGSTSSEQHARLYHQGRPMRQIAFDQPISFPFNFTWPGAFSIVIDAWYESPTGLQQLGATYHQARSLYQQPPHQHIAQQQQQQQQQQFAAASTSYDLYKKQLIIQHSMHGWLTVKNEWTSGMHKTDTAQLVYSYRVTCQPNYYGEQCNILCRPRDDVYGHSTCSDQGDVVCLAGWQGKYCEDPICTPGCHKDQGNCTRPNECNCRYGWQGSACEQCVRYPGCVHGTCSRPHECVCEEGWGGLLCNEDLRYCTNHQPCKNGATCKNRFDETGEGSYVCICDEGFTGKNCERRVQDNSAQQASYQQVMQNQTATSQLNSTLINQQQQQQQSISQQQTRSPGNKFPSGKPISLVSQPQQQQQMQIQMQMQHFQQPSTISGSPFHQQPPMSQPSTTAPASLDHRVMVAYGIIIVCMVILVVLLLLRVFFERLSGAVVGCGQRLVASGSSGTLWPSQMITQASHETDRRRSSSSRRHRHHHHRHHHHHQSTRSLGLGAPGSEHDVATLQNHQNIYKSRSSLGTDKAPVFVPNSDTCSSSASSISSSSSAEDLANHHANLQAHYSAYGSHHYAPAHHLAAAAAAAAAAAHQHQHQHHYHNNPYAASAIPATASTTAPLNHPYHHLAAAHSVHNLSSATYQRLSHHLNQQPPPPPYTISGNISSNTSGGNNNNNNNNSNNSSSQIYNSQSTTYAPAQSLYAGGAGNYHPASLILAPPALNSIYSTNSTYGTAATLAAHCVSAGGYGMSRGVAAAASASTLPLESATSSPKKSRNPNKESPSKDKQRPETKTTTTTTTMTTSSGNISGNQQATAATYGNIESQAAPTNESVAHETPVESDQPSGAPQQQAQSNEQSPYYFFMCNHS